MGSNSAHPKNPPGWKPDEQSESARTTGSTASYHGEKIMWQLIAITLMIFFTGFFVGHTSATTSARKDLRRLTAQYEEDHAAFKELEGKMIDVLIGRSGSSVEIANP